MYTALMYASVLFSAGGAHRRMMSRMVVHPCLVTYVRMVLMAALMPCAMVQNVSNSLSEDGITLPLHGDDDMRMFRGLLLRIPLVDVVSIVTIVNA